MGRNSKSEEEATNETAETNQQSATAFPFTPNNSNRTSAVSESESMARDIKEGRLSGFVGAGTVLTGETNFQSMLRVDGHLTGRVTSEEGTLYVGSTGQVDANVDVGAAEINGMVNGDITTSKKLELGRSARVVGNIKTPRLLIADGAILEGSCSMVESKENLEQRAVEQQQYSTGESKFYTSLTSYEESGEDELSEDESVDESEEIADAVSN